MGPLRSTPPQQQHPFTGRWGVGIPKAAVGNNESRWGCPCGGSQTSFAKTMVPSRPAWACPALPYGNHRSPHQAIRMWPPAPAPLPAQIHRCFQEPPPQLLLSPLLILTTVAVYYTLTGYHSLRITYLPSFSHPPASYKRGH